MGLCDDDPPIDVFVPLDKNNITAQRHTKSSAPKLCDDDPPIDVFVPLDKNNIRAQRHTKSSAPKLCDDDPPIDVFVPLDKNNITAQRHTKSSAPKLCDDDPPIDVFVPLDKNNITAQRHTKSSAPKLCDDDPPIDVFVPLELSPNVSEYQCNVGVLRYCSPQQFINNLNTVLKSDVIRVETDNCKIKGLSDLLINFTVNSSEIIPENHNLSCQFYNETDDRWDDTGSFTNLENFKSSNIITCSYDHMTPFAVLLVDMNQTPTDRVQWKILSYITYIGCSFSSFFSAVTIFLYIFMKSSNREHSIGIHVSLSVAHLLLNFSFLFTEWGATWSQEGACVFIAVIIQYSLLSCFSWMAIEAIHLYLLLIKVFNTYIKQYMVKLSLFGWGVPAVLVGGSLCVFGSNPFYGTTQIKLSDTNETMQFCWITDSHFLYGMNITCFCLMFLFNACVLVAVTSQIFKLRSLNDKDRKLPSHKDICTVLGLTFLLGMTWGLVFFTSGYTNYPVLYLFCIFNSLQGLFLFLWFYGTMKRSRRLEAQTSTMSAANSNTATAYESSFAQ
ncbi:adhesion G-protein coupled receptor G2-like isoform X2 [Neoarius graeffei]|uniref:adhesion G-protein coupled receptor G2-like isoform X2 n=1 Tax=Neoarius graeffei TaxID=443677 RepID=UPI00298D3189|nr:adhesion G-protein coupled receptor G2-like isoform X2 [Neoarius graeffei]